MTRTGPPEGLSFRAALSCAALCCLLALAVWGPHVAAAAEFWFDDWLHIRKAYQSGLAFDRAGYLPWSPAHRPLGHDAYAAALLLFGTNALAFHRLQWLAHGLNAALCALALCGMTGRRWPALAGAAVFAFGPAAFYPVQWSAICFDLLSVTFLLLALNALVWSQRLPEGTRARAWLWWSVLPAAYLAAKAKESALVFGPMCALYLLCFGRSGAWLRAKLRKGAAAGEYGRAPTGEWLWLGAMAAWMLVVALCTHVTAREAAGPDDPYAMVFDAGVALHSLDYFLSLFAWHPNSEGLFGSNALALVVLLAPPAAAFVLRNRLLGFGWAWYAAFLLPLAFLKNHYAQLNYPYPATIGAAAALAGLLAQAQDSIEARFPREHLARAAVSGLNIVVLMAASIGTSLWLREGQFPRDHAKLMRSGRAVRQGLLAALPKPEPFGELVVIAPPPSALDQDASACIQGFYREFTLGAMVYRTPDEAARHQPAAPERTLYFFWNGRRFVKVRPAQPAVNTSGKDQSGNK